MFNEKADIMTNNTYAVITTAKEALEYLAENVEELEHASTDAAEERVGKAKRKLKSAAGMVREAFSILDQE